MRLFSSTPVPPPATTQAPKFELMDWMAETAFPAASTTQK
jgi:hypothetical protein